LSIERYLRHVTKRFLYRPLVGSFLLFVILFKVANGATFYVSTKGDDRSSGNQAHPWKTLLRARDAIRASGLLGRETIEIIVSGGTYYLTSTLAFGHEDSGTSKAPVIYRAKEGDEVIISGGLKLALKWQKVTPSGLVMSAKVPAGVRIDQLFVDGMKQRMARYPNYDPQEPIYGGYASDAVSPARVRSWADPSGGFLHVLHEKLWGGFDYEITGKNADGSLRLDGGWQNNRPAAMHERYRYVENIREELDAPGEWFYDLKKQLLYFYPPASVNMEHTVIEVNRLTSLVELRGNCSNPVRSIIFNAFKFRHANRTFMETKEPLLRSDWCIYRGGAVFLEGTEDCALVDCDFEALGGNAIFLSGYNRNDAIRGCWIRECGASGVAFVGQPGAVRNGVTTDSKAMKYSEIDLTPGPRNEEYPAECAVSDCLIMSIGQIEKQVAGVEISMAKRITVRNCTIAGSPRAGINIGDGTWGGHLIEGCDVFDTVLETADHGSFNSWGRDRYWHLSQAPENFLPELALLDATEPTILRNSRWRCDHGWDIDLDDGSSNYYIYNNLLLGGGLKLREGYRRHVWNNVIINNSLHPHAWYRNSGDTFTRNIVMGRYLAALMDPDSWGQEIDYNYFTSNDSDRDAYQKVGLDAHSLVGLPQFINAPTGDFRVSATSSVFSLGFENFTMDKFGVTDARLRAHAPTPKIPPLRNITVATKAPTYEWLGATIRLLEAQEYSVFGVSIEAGGIVLLEAPGHVDAVHLGLRVGDVIMSVDGHQLKSISDLNLCMSKATEGSRFRLVIHREQTDLDLYLYAPISSPNIKEGSGLPPHSQ